jgi:hypothetical protein
MPADFDRCVRQGGKVRTVSGPDKEHGLAEGEYVRYCFSGGKSYRGEVRKKKKSNALVTPIPQANRAYQEIRINAEQDGEIQSVKWRGEDHLVVPVIMLVEGVLHSSNADHPALALSSEFGIFPQSWDGRPVVFSHPSQDGQAVSANQPDLWENEVIGFLFNSGMKGKKKLRSYMYLNRKKTPKDVLKAFEDGKTVEVSTGLWSLEEKTEGEYEGKEYKSVWRNIVPDHLAVLPLNAVGACSIADGCGAPRLNESQGDPMTQPQPKVTQAAAANPQAEQPCSECEEQLRENLIKSLDSFLGKIVVLDPTTGLKANEVSDVDKRTALMPALDAAYESGWCYILALFSGEVVYSHFDPMNYSFSLYKRSYSVAEGGAVTLGADITEVRPETKYVPLVIAVNQPATQEGNAMSQQQQQQQQAAAGQAPTPSPAPAPQANAQPANQPVAAAPVTEPTPAPQPAAAPQAPVANAEPKKATSFDELKAAMSPELRMQLDGMIKAQEQRRTVLINGLKDKVGLSEDDLKAMSSETLEKMHAKISGQQPSAPVDYSGAAGAQPAANQQSEKFTPPTPLFDQDFKVNVGVEKGGPIPQKQAA